jgi:hypothetical protein
MTEEMIAPKGQGLGSVIMNVFSSPGDAVADLRTSESKASNWLIPLVILIAVASVSSYVIFTNETLKSQALEAQTHAIQKQVDEGKMTQEQADQARSRMDNMGGMLIAFGIIGSTVFLSVMMFGAGLCLWLVDKFLLKSTAGYAKHLELYGISSWIGVLGSVVTLLMIVGLNSMYASPSAALAVYSTFDPLNMTHKLLSALNLFSIWQVVVVGIGVGKLSEKSATTGIGLALVLWIVWVAVSNLLLGIVR